MESTTTSETTFRAVIVHEDGKFGYTYNVPRETADEAFADRDRLANEDPALFSPDGHKVEFIVTKTTVTTTVTEVVRA